MEDVEETGYGGGVAGVFAVVFAEFAGVAVEGPGFGDFYGCQFDYDVHRADAVEVVGEMGADAERGEAFPLGISLYLNGFVYVEAVAEYDLLRQRVDVEALVFLHYQVSVSQIAF